MRDIWFALSSIVPSMLWLLRNATIHKGHQYTPAQARAKIVDAAFKQLYSVAAHRRRTVGYRLQGTCMQHCLEALEAINRSPQPHAHQRLTINFDDGARGNPGPCGSEWALTHTTDQGSHLLECGSAYGDPMTTNNKGEFAGLKLGLYVNSRLLKCLMYCKCK